MQTLEPARLHSHAATVRLTSRRGTDFIDVTTRLAAIVADASVLTGTLTVQSLHTTAAIIVNEGEPLLLEDFAAFLERLAPAGGSYQHDDMARRVGVPPDEPVNGHAHCRALLLPTSATVTVVDGQLRLGRWQRVFLVDFDGPRVRDLAVVVVGEAGR